MSLFEKYLIIIYNMEPSPPNNSPAARSFDDIISPINAANEEFLADERDLIEKTINTTPDKELFDIEKLKDFFDLHDDDGVYRLTEERIYRLKRLYYLTAKEVKTLKEFGEWYEKFESRDGN